MTVAHSAIGDETRHAMACAGHRRWPMERDGFRKEAVDGQVASWLGPIRLATPVSLRLWAGSAAVMAAAVVAWLFLGHYTRREHVHGNLVPAYGLMTITARSAGTVSHVEVAEDAEVHAGDPLLTLSGERSSATMGDTSANISAQLRAQEAHLKEDILNTQRLAKEQASDLAMQQTMLHHQIEQLDQQMAIEQRLADSVNEVLQRIEPLTAQGYVSALELQQQRTQKLDAEAQVKALARQRDEATQQLHSAENQLRQLPLVTEGKLSETRRQIAQAEQSLDQNEADRSVVMRAPGDGFVTSLLVLAGQGVTPGQSLVAIMPKSARLQAQLMVPSSAMGFVRAGGAVALHYQAFPYQKFGSQSGTVARISRSALTPPEVVALAGEEPPKEAQYRVLVDVPSQSVMAYGKEEPLRPGMTLDADLLLDDRRVIEWIFEPLYGIGHRDAEGKS